MEDNVKSQRTIEDIYEDFINKIQVYKSLVGTLYPSIVYNELLALREEYKSLGGDQDKLPWVPCPTPEGRVPPL